MLIIVAIMLCGIAVGYLLRNWDTRFISHIITVLIWLLLFLLGIEVGSNPRIVMGMQTLGIEALVLTIGGAVGTILCAWLLWIYVSRKEASK
ncbi:MAG: LysO family transporter [Prevotella sp.]|nr:LysO family transporter [Prevotellaceae bacterium]MDY5344033.1 LysO family transporter [Prevotella sp.]